MRDIVRTKHDRSDENGTENYSSRRIKRRGTLREDAASERASERRDLELELNRILLQAPSSPSSKEPYYYYYDSL